jgi:hypothetical protein
MIEGVRLDFFGERNEGLPEEVTQLYLRRETVALGRQIEQALTLAFGDNSRQRGRLRELGLTAASSQSDGRAAACRQLYCRPSANSRGAIAIPHE